MTGRLPNVLGWMDRHQVWLYLVGLVCGAAVGLAFPSVAPPAQIAIQPVLGLLLYATFLGIPLQSLSAALKDERFISAVLILNFLIVPIVVFVLSRIVAFHQVLLVGVLFVLLTPCIDYVIVFAGLAGGDTQRLLVAAPVLMLIQIALLPLYLWLFVGEDFLNSIEIMPFVEAFIWLIVVPLGLAALTQFAARRWRIAKLLNDGFSALMIPLMMTTLGVVVASQIDGVRGQLGDLLLTVPVYVLFALVMVPLGMLIGRLAKLGTAQQRSLVFSGATRNSLVVLPLVLALPATYDLAPLVVVTQTLIELVFMVLFVKFIPRIIRSRTTD